MTKNTKTLLTIGGIAVVGYILWKQGVFGGKKSANFSNLVGETQCPSGYTPIKFIDENGTIKVRCHRQRISA